MTVHKRSPVSVRSATAHFCITYSERSVSLTDIVYSFKELFFRHGFNFISRTAELLRIIQVPILSSVIHSTPLVVQNALPVDVCI